MIYYHGTRPTDEHPTKIEELLDDKDYVPYMFQPLFINVSQIPDEELKQHGAMSGIDLLFKHIFDKPTPKLLISLLETLSSNSSDVQYYALQYMIGRFDIDKESLINKALNYLESEKVMTVAEQLKQEGKQENSRMIACNALKEGADIEFVAKITGLSLDEVKALQEKIDG